MTLFFSRKISSLDGIFKALNGWIDALKIDVRTAYALQLAVEEVFTNLVKYNTTATADIRMRLELQDHKMIIELQDYDVDDFDISKPPPVDPEAPLENRRVGGLGLYLTHRIMDRVEYHYENRTSTITLYKSLSEELC